MTKRLDLIRSAAWEDSREIPSSRPVYRVRVNRGVPITLRWCPLLVVMLPVTRTNRIINFSSPSKQVKISWQIISHKTLAYSQLAKTRRCRMSLAPTARSERMKRCLLRPLSTQSPPSKTSTRRVTGQWTCLRLNISRSRTTRTRTTSRVKVIEQATN